jgi:hypothetical protein
VRGTCTIFSNYALREICGKPSVYSQPCLCDECDALHAHGTEPIHLPSHFCAYHHDEITRPCPAPDVDCLA